MVQYARDKSLFIQINPLMHNFGTDLSIVIREQLFE